MNKDLLEGRGYKWYLNREEAERELLSGVGKEMKDEYE